MTQEAETVAVDLEFVSCQTCDAVFVASERRQTCPSCGGEPTGPYLQFVLDAAGLHLKDGGIPTAAPAPPAEEPAPEAEAPAAEAPAAEEPVEETDWLEVFVVGVTSYLQSGGGLGVTEDDLATVLLENLGAEPEDAAAAVGRLQAVRDLLRELTQLPVEAQVEVTVEPGPEEGGELEGEREPRQNA
ncbi:hypothetical protein LCGC14_1302670 [marine sediment metagenome]|uniref:Uncharacterized protein n=1 Tax=marine sediment metagenome TaxID=412755 RepID=A0A0F9NS27_9ZZZZ